MSEIKSKNIYDLFVIGGGVNGVAIARDASGRGFSVALAEMNDLASATSGSSTKLFHGGLRYLEYMEFKLVRDSLREREVLLRNMPHIAWPMRFILPFSNKMKFKIETPVFKFINLCMPWLKGRRPSWLVRWGLFLYDNIGYRKFLKGTTSYSLGGTPEGAPLLKSFKNAFEYSDVWVQDARLVSLMAQDAKLRGANIMTYTKVTSVIRHEDFWSITVLGVSGTEIFRAKNLVNAGGPWVDKIITKTVKLTPKSNIRLVKGSHIVIRKLYNHDKCYFLQGRDGRIIFTIPYEDDYTLIGTTDVNHVNSDRSPEISTDEINYLCEFVSSYFLKTVSLKDIVWKYSGVRPLYDDGTKSATAATREYVLNIDNDQAPILSVYGGKITTHRKLAEEALGKLSLSNSSENWTHTAPLPGGEFDFDQISNIKSELMKIYPFANKNWLNNLFKRYGVNVTAVLGDAKSYKDLGDDFSGGLYQAEVEYLVENEFAKTAEDILWRRTKIGLKIDKVAEKKLKSFLKRIDNMPI